MSPARPVIDAYIDIRSPYSFATLEPLRALASEGGAELRWHFFAIDIEAAFGRADARTARELRKVRYLYMDVRRLARAQGLVIKGPRKIYDPTLAHRVLISVRHTRGFDAILDDYYRRFFDHTLDIEDEAALIAVAEQHLNSDARWQAEYLSRSETELAEEKEEAEALGVFGVPTFVVEGELFWGTDRLGMVAERLHKRSPA